MSKTKTNKQQSKLQVDAHNILQTLAFLKYMRWKITKINILKSPLIITKSDIQIKFLLIAMSLESKPEIITNTTILRDVKQIVMVRNNHCKLRSSLDNEA